MLYEKCEKNDSLFMKTSLKFPISSLQTKFLKLNVGNEFLNKPFALSMNSLESRSKKFWNFKLAHLRRKG